MGFQLRPLVGGMERLPRNVYFGDGSTIDDAVGKKIGGIYKGMSFPFGWQAGDFLLLDNMLVAHARDPYDGPHARLSWLWGTWFTKRQGR